MSVHHEAQRAELESLESEYASITGENLVTHQESRVVKYHLADGGEASSLDDAIKQGRALVRFVKNQKGQ